jgi:hypothetical protein
MRQIVDTVVAWRATSPTRDARQKGCPMDECDSCRVDAFALGVRTGPTLRAGIEPCIPADLAAATVAWLCVLEAIPKMFVVMGLMAEGGPEVRDPIQLISVLSPLREILTDAAKERLRPLSAAHRTAAIEAPGNMGTCIATAARTIDKDARAFPDPGCYWTGMALGLIADVFPRLELPPVIAHIVRMEDAAEMLAALMAGRESDVAEYPINPVQH